MAMNLGARRVPGKDVVHIRLLAVTPHSEDYASLERILDRSRCTILRAPGCKEAMRAIDRNRPQVVLCERDLPDGNWRDLFRALGSLRNPPPFIVASNHADEALWAEVLNVGGYDVLAKPFDREEVDRVMNSAWRAWDLRNLDHALNTAERPRIAYSPPDFL